MLPDRSAQETHVPGRPYEYHLTIGFPPTNTEGDIPSLLTMIFGKISMDGKIRLESIQFPEPYLKKKGPSFGVQGIREMVGEVLILLPYVKQEGAP